MNPSLELATRLVLVTGMATLTCACGGDETAIADTDLPQGWEGASPLTELTQTECEGSPYDGMPDAMTASAGDHSVEITYSPAHFRCAQLVEAFARFGTGTLDVLVQPVDMNPASIAKCDCLYTIEMKVAAASGDHVVAVYRRWDHRSGSATPLKIGEEEVSIP